MAALNFSTPDDREELARAEVYGLLARLLHAAPSEALYEQLRVAATQAPAPGAFLEAAWSGVVAASRRIPWSAACEEHGALFLGVGKPEVFLYGSYFVAGALNEKPLVSLRHDLRELGLERQEGVLETEDHLSSLCEVMRYLIAGEDVAVSNLARQQSFFDAHLCAWPGKLWDLLDSHPRADFYRAVGAFGRDFFDVEAQAFDMLG